MDKASAQDQITAKMKAIDDAAKAGATAHKIAAQFDLDLETAILVTQSSTLINRLKTS